MSITKITDHYISCAKKQLLEGGNFSPRALLEKDESLFMFILDFSSDVAKVQSMEMLKHAANKIQADYSIILSEAWAVMPVNGRIDTNLPPSMSPNRIEVLMASAEHRNGEKETSTWAMQRTNDDNKIYELKELSRIVISPESNTGLGLGGLMTGILEPTEIRENLPKEFLDVLDKMIADAELAGGSAPNFTVH